MKKVKPLRKNAAFTLVEVLITITVIGVVAALTIPNLITNYQKQQTAAKLKESYAILQNAIRLAEADYDSVSGWELDTKHQLDNIDKYLMPYLKATKRKIILKNLYKDISGEDEWALCVFVCGGRTNTAITLLNGAEIISTNANGSLNEIFFILDINGFNNGPNMLGKDAFYLQIVPAIGGLTFMRKDDGESWDVIKTRDQLLNGPSGGLQKYQCNKKGRGTWCGELIRRDGWKISKDYPW